MEIEELVQRQRDFFRTGRTKDVAFRIAALQKLENSIVKYEKEINEALYADLHKSAFEGYMTEVGLSLSELRFLIKNTAVWSKTRPVSYTHLDVYKRQGMGNIAIYKRKSDKSVQRHPSLSNKINE